MWGAPASDCAVYGSPGMGLTIYTYISEERVPSRNIDAPGRLKANKARLSHRRRLRRPRVHSERGLQNVGPFFGFELSHLSGTIKDTVDTPLVCRIENALSAQRRQVDFCSSRKVFRT